MSARWIAIGMWLAIEVDGCTCGAGQPYGHEQYCGLEQWEPVESQEEAERLALMANLSGGVPI